MTWNEFKKHIDILLDKEGISHDEIIWYIDTSFPDCKVVGETESSHANDCPDVALNKHNGISISS